MLKHIYLIGIATLLFGFITGVLIYLQSHTGEERENNLRDAEQFSIVGRMYGGCESLGCASYSIDADGSYTYIQNRAGEEERFEGKLARSNREEIEDALQQTQLRAVEDSVFTGTCPIAFDGPAYRYDLVYGGERYSIDTCRQDTAGEPLFALLEQYFSLFEERHDM